jgi:sigma-E factor negative regulatory protein RseA
MQQTKPISYQEVSALMDEAVAGPDTSLAFDRLLAAEDAQATWHRYHLIGDVIRSESLAPSGADLGFAQRVMDSLASDPSLKTQKAQSAVESQLPEPQKLISANASKFQIRAVAGAFGVCVLAFILFALFQDKQDTAAGAQSLATEQPQVKAPVEVALEEERPVMTRDPELDALLSAHQEMGGHSALQTPAGFLRNATFDRSKR